MKSPVYLSPVQPPLYFVTSSWRPLICVPVVELSLDHNFRNLALMFLLLASAKRQREVVSRYTATVARKTGIYFYLESVREKGKQIFFFQLVESIRSREKRMQIFQLESVREISVREKRMQFFRIENLSFDFFDNPLSVIIIVLK
jgi:hypothetical protein